jgi:hypothetical protein
MNDMEQQPHRYADAKPETPRIPRKKARANALQSAQVMPPHHVDLTLSPVGHEDVHVPADVNGEDLSRDGRRGRPLPRRLRKPM